MSHVGPTSETVREVGGGPGLVGVVAEGHDRPTETVDDVGGLGVGGQGAARDVTGTDQSVRLRLAARHAGTHEPDTEQNSQQAMHVTASTARSRTTLPKPGGNSRGG